MFTWCSTLHCIFRHSTAPSNATACKIKDMTTPRTFGDAVKVNDTCFLNILDRNEHIMERAESL